jgi:hypothetical protein
MPARITAHHSATRSVTSAWPASMPETCWTPWNPAIEARASAAGSASGRSSPRSVGVWKSPVEVAIQST